VGSVVGCGGVVFGFCLNVFCVVVFEGVVFFWVVCLGWVFCCLL
jgi:hypothetical protein